MLPQLKKLQYSNYIGSQIYIPASTVFNNSVSESPVTYTLSCNTTFTLGSIFVLECRTLLGHLYSHTTALHAKTACLQNR